MEPHIDMNVSKEQYPQEQSSAASNTIRSHWRLLWVVSSSLSLMSSRYLFVDLNIHYPLHLHFVQLVTAALLTTHLNRWRQQDEGPKGHSEQLSTRGWIVLTVISSLMAVSTMLSIQAVMHNHNLPTLPMITIIAFFAEGLILFIAGHVPRSKTETLRLGLLMAACAGILVGEYRLLVPALLTSIPTMLLAGVARGLRHHASTYYSNALANSRRMNTLFYYAGFVATVVAILFRSDENPVEFFCTFRIQYIPVLLVNALSTATAIFLGKSILFPFVDMGKSLISEATPGHPLRDTLTLLALTSITGCWATLKLRRSYATGLQFVIFFLAVVCICGKAIFGTSRNWYHSSGTHVRYSTVSVRHYPDEEDSVMSDITEEKFVEEVEISRKKLLINILLGGTALISLWGAYSMLNFSEQIHASVARVEPVLDHEYAPTVPVEIVISMYKEPVEEVSDLIIRLKEMPHFSKARVKIYIKDVEADNKYIQRHTQADDVATIPNIGREGETYLHHILDQWDNLAKHTVFLQADVHNPREFYPRIRDYYDPERTGMLSLGWSGHVCNCEDCGDRYGWWDTTNLFQQIHNRINNSTSCENVLLSYKGQFIASAARIRGVDRSVYSDLREAFVDKDSWAHKEAERRGRPDSMSAPDFGYTMERIWNLLFQCSSMDVAWRCPSLVSRNRWGGNIEDCQCFDPVL